MLAKNPKTVIQLLELLPADGESGVSYQREGSSLTVKVFFDGEGEKQEFVSILFTGVAMTHIASVPGVENFGVECTGEHEIGNVIEYTSSEAADAWSTHLGRSIRHFHLYFLEENQRCDVFATDCKVIPAE